jgi:hypothetical protein
MALTDAERAEVQALRDAAYAALLRLLGGFREAEFNGRRYREHNIDEVRKLLDGLDEQLARDTAGGMRVRQIVPGGLE